MGLPAWWSDTKTFLVPSLVVAAVLFSLGQKLLGGIVVAVSIGFLSWILYHRCGLLATIVPKRGVSYALRMMRQNLHHRLFQVRCLETIEDLINMRASKGARIVERGGVKLIVRALHLYGDGEEDGGDSEIVERALIVLLGLVRTSPKTATLQVLSAWPIKDIANRLGEVSGDLDRSEEDRDNLSLLLLKLISQICEAVAPSVRTDALAWRNELVDSVLLNMQRSLRSKKSEEIHQWSCCALYNLQHQSKVIKVKIAKSGGLARVLDSVRVHRSSLSVNKIAAVFLCEILFEPLLDIKPKSGADVSKSNKPELRFLPDVLAEAIDLGVMQAMYEMQKRHTSCVEIFNCNRLIKHELGKARSVDIAENAKTFTVIDGSDIAIQ